MAKNGISRSDLVEKISEHTNIRPDVVNVILSGLVDVIVEEIITNKAFALTDFVIVKAHKWRNAKDLKNDDVLDDHERLRVRLSPTLHKIWKVKQKFPDEDINASNWKDYVALERSGELDLLSQTDNFVDFNPFLNDEDDY